MKSASIALKEIMSDRYLGDILDNKLSFNVHIERATKIPTNSLNFCRRNLNTCNYKSKETFKALVRQHLDYASSAWSPFTKC